MNENIINPWEQYIVIFKALSDPTRLKIMWLLYSINSKISVSEIIDVLEETQYNVSKHLKILKNSGLIYEKKEGRWSFYYCNHKADIFYSEIRKTVQTISNDLMSDEISRCNKRLSMRVNGKCVLGAESDKWDKVKSTKK